MVLNNQDIDNISLPLAYVADYFLYTLDFWEFHILKEKETILGNK